MKGKNEGITLISLVITIIILIILATVSITTLIGENGIITKASEARKTTEIQTIIEKARIDILEIQTQNKGNMTKEQLQVILKKYFEDVPQILPKDLETLVLTTKEEYGKHKIKVSEIYQDTENIILTANDIASNPNKSVYYGATVTGYTCPNSEAVNSWKIFYADNSNIYLIADDYISYKYVPNGKGGNSLSKGDTDYKVFFNNIILSDYSGSNDITDKKIQALNNDYFNIKGYTSTNANMKAVAYMLDINVWSVYKGERAEYAIGGPTIELLLKSYNQKYNVHYIAQAFSDKGYQVSMNEGLNWYNYCPDMLQNGDSLYLIGSTQKAVSMRLASPAGNSVSYLLDVIWHGAVASNNVSKDNIGFRPIVCLNSNVQLKKNVDGTYIIK